MFPPELVAEDDDRGRAYGERNESSGGNSARTQEASAAEDRQRRGCLGVRSYSNTYLRTRQMTGDRTVPSPGAS